MNTNTYRLLFLGAGFSCLAGLPLGPALFHEVRRRIRIECGVDNRVEHDLKRLLIISSDASAAWSILTM
jgi:hypothetical protein